MTGGQRQLRSQTTSVKFTGSRAERKVTRTWSGCGCVKDVLPRPYRKMRFSVVWAALYSGLVDTYARCGHVGSVC